MCTGKLYLCPTPIGNLEDITLRTLRVLREVDIVAAEDTRRSLTLLNHFEIKKPMISYFEHNKRERGEIIVERILAGESCALVTDAGTPAISDPGEDIVALCAERGVPVTSIPGACAAVTALSVSGLPTGRFVFEGFITTVKNDRRERLLELATEKRTMILYEAPHKLKATLADMAEIFGVDRKISLCRELTKLNEEIARLSLGEAVKYYENNEPRGEYVLVIEGFCGKAPDAGEDLTMLSPEEHVARYEAEGMKRMDAIKKAAKDRGMSKSDLYKLLIEE